MSKLGELFTDDYNLETLTAVAAVLALPLAASAALVGLNIGKLTGLTVMGVEVILFPLWLVANSIREAGTAAQGRIFANGMPTTRCLRLRENNGYEVDARRERLQRISGVTLLTKRQEQAHSDEADQRILDAVSIAKEKMRSKKNYLLLRRDNKAYGFWRNMYAMRWTGFGISLLSAVIAAVATFVSDNKALPAAALAVALLMAAYWLMAANERRVTAAGERYRDQFFKSLTTL